MKLGRARIGAISVLVIGAVTAVPARALAKKRAKGATTAVQACVEDYKTGLKLEETGQLISAREKYVRCSKLSCGSPLHEECTTRFTQLDGEIPSVVPIATDAEGAPRFDVLVKMDGQVLTEKLDGHAWQLDPGRHELSFSADGEVFSTQEVLIVQGQRNRTVLAMLASPDKRVAPSKQKKVAVAAAPPTPAVAKKPKEVPAPEVVAQQVVEKEEAEKEANGPEVTLATASDEAHTSKLPYVLGAAGLASIGAGAAFIYWGRKDNNSLSSCSSDVTNCSQAAVDHVHRMYLIGNVALGAGVAALGTAVFLHARSGPSKEAPSENEAYRFDVVPTNSGAVASVSGAF